MSSAKWGVLTLLVLFLAVGVGARVTGSENSRPRKSSTSPHEDPQPEQLDHPQVRVRRDLMPRTEALPVVLGMHQSIQVNLDEAGNNIVGDAANEPSLAIDPTDPDHIVIGWRQFDTTTSNFRQAGMAYSHDGGATWSPATVLDPGQFRSDPVLAADFSGDFYYYSLSSITSVDMFISANGGMNWGSPIQAPGGDKTWMTIDITGGVGTNTIYAIWNSQFTCCALGTDFTRSLDGGLTYQGPYVLPSHPKWGTLAVGPSSELYVVGARLDSTSFPQPHLLLKSTNAWNSAETPAFPQVTAIDLGGETSFSVDPNPAGLLGQVWVAVDHSFAESRGNVYLLGSVDPPGEDPLDVMFIRSRDGGLTFSPPLRINHDTAERQAYQWFGTLSVAPDGRLDAIWNDTFNDVSDLVSEVFYAYSIDEGDTWSEALAVTPAWNSLLGFPMQNKIGDYYHMISDPRGAALAYSATFNGEQDIYFLRVGDCNGNGQHDSLDLFPGNSLDCDQNGIPDECKEPTTCPPCEDDLDCGDGVLCNGEEFCDLGTGRCHPGLPPICDDLDSCTADSCEVATDSCLNTTIPVPGQLPFTVSLGHDTSTEATTISWSPAFAPDHYNTYRGTIPATTLAGRGPSLYDHVCFENADGQSNGMTLTVDFDVPPLGESFYYAVSAENACAEGSLGRNSVGGVRPNSVPCPTPP